MKVATIVGTRPEIIKLSRVIAALDKVVDHTLIHTGQNYDYELNEIFFNEMGIRPPDRFLGAAGGTTIETISNIMPMLERLLMEIKPDAILILGDTNSCLAAAYVAKRRKIPIFHMEAGNRCFDQRVPEEINRVLVDHLSDINLPYSDHARENLMRENLPTDRVIKTGSPQAEVLNFYDKEIRNSQVLSQLNLSYREYFVASLHREENVDTPERLKQFRDLLNRLVDTYHKRVIVSVHPRTRKKLEESTTDLYDVRGYQNGLKQCASEIDFHKPFGFFDYVWLQCNAICTLSDSGTITEESSILGFPALNLRETHERPEGMEEASVIMTGFERAVGNISAARASNIPRDYQNIDVSHKVVCIILSYVDYVNRNVWRKK